MRQNKRPPAAGRKLLDYDVLFLLLASFMIVLLICSLGFVPFLGFIARQHSNSFRHRQFVYRHLVAGLNEFKTARGRELLSDIDQRLSGSFLWYRRRTLSSERSTPICSSRWSGCLMSRRTHTPTESSPCTGSSAPFFRRLGNESVSAYTQGNEEYKISQMLMTDQSVLSRTRN